MAPARMAAQIPSAARVSGVVNQGTIMQLPAAGKSERALIGGNIRRAYGSRFAKGF